MIAFKDYFGAIFFVLTSIAMAHAQSASSGTKPGQQDAAALGPAVVSDGYPLRPAVTSSPRATLRSFNTNMIIAIKAWRSVAPRDVLVNSYRHVFETFDFSRLPKRERLAKQLETAILMKEILDRIELPPREEIPGEAEVADKNRPVFRWTIPSTQLSIAKIKEGPREGEFLFTAETVERLKEFYRRSKHLP